MEATHCAPRRWLRPSLECLAFTLLGIAVALSLAAPIVMPLPTGMCLTLPDELGLPRLAAPGGATGARCAGFCRPPAATPLPIAGRAAAGLFGGQATLTA